MIYNSLFLLDIKYETYFCLTHKPELKTIFYIGENQSQQASVSTHSFNHLEIAVNFLWNRNKTILKEEKINWKMYPRHTTKKKKKNEKKRNSSYSWKSFDHNNNDPNNNYFSLNIIFAINY